MPGHYGKGMKKGNGAKKKMSKGYLSYQKQYKRKYSVRRSNGSQEKRKSVFRSR